MKPDDKNNLSYFDNVVNLIHLLENSTEDYYNMRMVLELKACYQFIEHHSTHNSR